MKSEKEIQNRIEDVENARTDLNDMGNLTEGLLNEFNTKIETLRWILK